MSLPRNAAGILLASLTMAGVDVVSGQEYPDKPVRVVTSGAGGGGDFISRVVAQGISGPLGQPVIVDNRASAVLAAEVGAKAAPDGYTLNIGGESVWNNTLLRKMPYDIATDFSPISLLVREVFLLVVHPSLPVKSVSDLIALAKARPGQLNYFSANVGGTSHLGVELFKSMANVNIVHVPYKGNVAAMTALISGEVQMGMVDAGLAAPHTKSGKLKALAVTSAEPSALTPRLPTVAASGLPGYSATGVTGIFAPARTPAAIVNRLNQEIVRLLNQPDVKSKLLSAGAEAVGNSPDQFAAFIKSELVRLGKVIKDANIKVD